MSVNGFHWEGFLRAMQGEIMALVGFIIFLLFIGWIVAWLTKRAVEERKSTSEEMQEILKWRGKIIKLLIIISLLIFGWQAVTFIAANRIPRADVDKSSVYDQMDSNIKH